MDTGGEKRMNARAVFASFPELESKSLLLAKIGPDHLEDVFAIYSDELVFAYCGILTKKNKETVRNMIGHYERDYNKQTRIKWGIFEQSDRNKLVGIIEAFEFHPKVNKVTIGYFLARSFWGKGIATEAVRLVVQFLFEKAQINRIQAEVMPPNSASKNVLLKNGFVKEGTLRQANEWAGKGIVDLEVYGLLKEEYSGSPL